MEQEIFDLVDEYDSVISQAAREAVHGNPGLIHRVAHVLVFNSHGELYLQKRSMDKDVQPGRWDTSVGGHVASGETYGHAAEREMAEELGIVLSGYEPTGPGLLGRALSLKGPSQELHFLHKYLHRNDYESEYVCTFRIVWDGQIRPDPGEIEEGRFWPLDAVASAADTGIFTPNFLDELNRYFAWELSGS